MGVDFNYRGVNFTVSPPKHKYKHKHNMNVETI